MSGRLSVLLDHLPCGETGSRSCAAAAGKGWLGTDQRWIELSEVGSTGGMRMSWIEDIGPVWCAWLAIKQVLHIKQVPLTLVRHPSTGTLRGGGGGQEELYALTAQKSLPVLWWEGERPRSAWIEQIMLAERVGSGPKLIPDDAAERVEMFGVLNELLDNVDGFCTHKRQMAFTKMGQLAAAAGEEQRAKGVDAFVSKYQFVDKARAPRRVVEVLNLLDGMVRRQEARGSRFIIGSALSVLDVYAAASVAVMAAPAGTPMGTKVLPQKMFGRNGLQGLMMAFALSTKDHPEIAAAFTPRLQAHRDYIMSNYFEKTATYFPE